MLLMHKMSKRTEKEPQGEDVATMLRQSKGGNPFLRQCAKLCLYCSKLGYIARFFYKTKNKKWKQVKNMNDDINYVFVMRNETHSKSVRKWIMDLEASKHMTSYKAAFDMYEVITSHNMNISDNRVVQVIKMRSIFIKTIFEGEIIKFIIKMCFTYANCMSICSYWAT